MVQPGHRPRARRRPACKYSNAFTGRNGATFTAATNAGLIFLVLDDFEERHARGLTIDRIADDMRGELAQIEEAQAFVFIPPPVRGMGAAAGFSMRLQDTLGMPAGEFARITQEFVAEANQHARHRQRLHHLPVLTPQVYVDVDRDKAQMLKVPVTAIFEAMRVFMGSAYVNDFNMFGRTYRVTAQADGDYRLDPGERIQDPRAQRRRADGAARQPRDLPGGRRARARAALQSVPDRRGNGTAQPGVSSGQALQIMRALANDKLPQGITYEWTDLSYQEAKVGRTGYYIFVLQRGLRVPGAGGAVRELVAAARHHADRADVPALRARSACGCTGARSTSSPRSASSCSSAWPPRTRS